MVLLGRPLVSNTQPFTEERGRFQIQSEACPQARLPCPQNPAGGSGRDSQRGPSTLLRPGHDIHLPRVSPRTVRTADSGACDSDSHALVISVRECTCEHAWPLVLSLLEAPGTGHLASAEKEAGSHGLCLLSSRFTKPVDSPGGEVRLLVRTRSPNPSVRADTPPPAPEVAVGRWTGCRWWGWSQPPTTWKEAPPLFAGTPAACPICGCPRSSQFCVDRRSRGVSHGCKLAGEKRRAQPRSLRGAAHSPCTALMWPFIHRRHWRCGRGTGVPAGILCFVFESQSQPLHQWKQA